MIYSILLKFMSARLAKTGEYAFYVILGLIAFFLIRGAIFHKIAQHDQSIITATEKRKDAEWQLKLDKEKLDLLEKIDNVRKTNKAIERSKPRNRPDIIKCLRERCINPV